MRALGSFAPLLGAAWLVACVPPLPVGALDEAATGGRGGVSGAAGTGGGGTGGLLGTGAISPLPTLAGVGGASPGSAGSGGDGMPATCGAPRCQPQPACVAPPPISNSVSGFESACNDIAPIDGRDGGWFVYATGTSSIDPSPGEPFRVACNGAGGSCYAGCISGTLSGSGYPTVGIGFVPRMDGAAYDASRYKGVSFAFFLGEAGPDAVVRFQVPLAADTMAGVGGGTCTTNCFDTYMAEIASLPMLRGIWSSASFPFASLHQRGFGAPEPWDPRTVISFQWVVAARSETVAGEPFFICVDQVALF